MNESRTLPADKPKDRLRKILTEESLRNLFDEVQTAQLLKVSIKTLQGWRQRKIGPRYFKLSNRVRYSPDDLKEYLVQCVVEPQRPDASAR